MIKGRFLICPIRNKINEDTFFFSFYPRAFSASYKKPHFYLANSTQDKKQCYNEILSKSVISLPTLTSFFTPTCYLYPCSRAQACFLKTFLRVLNPSFPNMLPLPTRCCAVQWAIWKGGGLTAHDRPTRSEKYLLLGLILVSHHNLCSYWSISQSCRITF